MRLQNPIAAICRATVGLTLLLATAGICCADAIQAITKPSEDVTLSFVRPGRVAKVLVKEGDAVDVGQVLMQQDDEEAQVLLEKLKAQAENVTAIELYKAQLDQKKVEATRREDLFKKGAATGTEVERARLEAITAEKYLDQAVFGQEQSRLEHQQTTIMVDRMRLKSPVRGKVEQLFVKAGEGADGLQKVVRVVKTDPLWIDVPVPLLTARGLSLQDKTQVAFPSGEVGSLEPVLRQARIIFIAAVADAASDTLTVRVEVPNADDRPAGERVKVIFPAASGAAGSDTSGQDASPGADRKGDVDDAQK